MNDADELVAHVVAPRLVEEVEEEGIEEIETAEPEVITAKKDEEEEE